MDSLACIINYMLKKEFYKLKAKDTKKCLGASNAWLCTTDLLLLVLQKLLLLVMMELLKLLELTLLLQGEMGLVLLQVTSYCPFVPISRCTPCPAAATWKSQKNGEKKQKTYDSLSEIYVPLETVKTTTTDDVRVINHYQQPWCTILRQVRPCLRAGWWLDPRRQRMIGSTGPVRRRCEARHLQRSDGEPGLFRDAQTPEKEEHRQLKKRREVIYLTQRWKNLCYPTTKVPLKYLEADRSWWYNHYH